MGILQKFSLKGRIALVTGGAGPQFGSSVCEGLAEAGSTVVSASRSLETNQQFVEKLRQEGCDAHAERVDITEPDSIYSLRDRLINRFGHIDILVNSAAVRRRRPFEDQTPEDWTYTSRGNMVGLFAMCQAFIGDMVRQRRGSIINISSMYSVVANDPSMYTGTEMITMPDYAFFKAGMINFTRYLANYYGKQGVRANCISPGGYQAKQPQSFLHRYKERCPLGRLLANEDIKGAVVFLASDASAYITGTNLLVDGGWTAL